MNGPHDMGGFTGFGPVMPEPDEPVWHAEWEPERHDFSRRLFELFGNAARARANAR